MKLIGQVIGVLFGILLLSTMGFGAYLTLEYIGALIASLDRQVAIVTGIACVVALAASCVLARAIRAASHQSKAIALREERAATYQLFVDYWENLLRQGRERRVTAPADLSEKLQVLDRLLALYGGAAVIEAHTALRGLERDKGAQHPDVRARFGEALAAIRKDLGSNTSRDMPKKLERLLLPVPNAAGATPETKSAGMRTVLAPRS